MWTALPHSRRNRALPLLASRGCDKLMCKGKLRMLDRREARERLTVFLPVSLVRRLKDTVPPGRRSDFITETLTRALEEEHTAGKETDREERQR